MIMLVYCWAHGFQHLSLSCIKEGTLGILFILLYFSSFKSLLFLRFDCIVDFRDGCPDHHNSSSFSFVTVWHLVVISVGLSFPLQWDHESGLVSINLLTTIWTVVPVFGHNSPHPWIFPLQELAGVFSWRLL